MSFDENLRKFSKFDDPGISMYRPVPLLVPLFPANYPDLDVDRFPDLISESGSPFQRFSRKTTHKTIRDVPVHTGVRSEQAISKKKKSLPREVVLRHLQIDFLA